MGSNLEILSFGFGICLLLFIGFVGATPTGPDSILSISNETGNGSSIGIKINISGGYISDVNISATVQNRNWKALIGNVDGSFVLDDSSGSTIYDWSLSSVSGEIYASRNNSIDWSGVKCANSSEVLAEETALEHFGGDNISSTFDGTNLEAYAVAGVTINIGDCFSTNTYVNDLSQTDSFEEFLLASDEDVIFATEINENTVGYNGSSYDFQMILPQNGNESVSDNTLYYLYVELS